MNAYVSGLDRPTSGSISLDDVDIASLHPQQKDFLHNQTFGFVFQFHYLMHELSILENVMLPGLIKGDSRRLCESRAQALLTQVGLAGKFDLYPQELSGGEQQRVAVVRAIFNRPRFLFADEPTGNLDAANAQQIVEILLSSQQEWGMGLILCSHDEAVYGKMQNLLRLERGLLKG